MIPTTLALLLLHASKAGEAAEAQKSWASEHSHVSESTTATSPYASEATSIRIDSNAHTVTPETHGCVRSVPTENDDIISDLSPRLLHPFPSEPNQPRRHGSSFRRFSRPSSLRLSPQTSTYPRTEDILLIEPWDTNTPTFYSAEASSSSSKARPREDLHFDIDPEERNTSPQNKPNLSDATIRRLSWGTSRSSGEEAGSGEPSQARPASPPRTPESPKRWVFTYEPDTKGVLHKRMQDAQLYEAQLRGKPGTPPPFEFPVEDDDLIEDIFARRGNADENEGRRTPDAPAATHSRLPIPRPQSARLPAHTRVP